jgi:RNA recognition motif-containing protein
MAKLFVGNLEWGTTNEELEEVFSTFGAVEEVFIVRDKFTGRSKGFGFVTMINDAESDAAKADLHEKDFKGRNLIVNDARPANEEEK